MDSLKCQTSTASPAEPGELPWLLAKTSNFANFLIDDDAGLITAPGILTRCHDRPSQLTSVEIHGAQRIW